MRDLEAENRALREALTLIAGWDGRTQTLGYEGPRNVARAALAGTSPAAPEEVWIRFTGLPGPDPATCGFIETETVDGRGVGGFEWRDNGDGTYSLGPFGRAASGTSPAADEPVVVDPSRHSRNCAYVYDGYRYPRLCDCGVRRPAEPVAACPQCGSRVRTVYCVAAPGFVGCYRTFGHHPWHDDAPEPVVCDCDGGNPGIGHKVGCASIIEREPSMTLRPAEPVDDLDEFLAEEMQDPSFRTAYEQAQRKSEWELEAAAEPVVADPEGSDDA